MPWSAQPVQPTPADGLRKSETTRPGVVVSHRAEQSKSHTTLGTGGTAIAQLAPITSTNPWVKPLAPDTPPSLEHLTQIALAELAPGFDTRFAVDGKLPSAERLLQVDC